MRRSSDKRPIPSQDELEVRKLLALAGSGNRPTDSEQSRIADAMWAALDEPRNERPHSRRVLLWAAMLLVAAGVVGLARSTTSEIYEPGASTEASRTTFHIGDTNVSFDTATGYYIETRTPASLTLIAGQANLRSHERITIAETEELFAGQDPDNFFSDAELLAESVASPSGSTAWVVSVGTTPTCSYGEPCVPIATTTGGEAITLTAGSYVRIEVYGDDEQDHAPVLIVSEVGSNTTGPALVNIELEADPTS